MNEKERAKITDLSKCDFKKMFTYFVGKNEERKNKTKRKRELSRRRMRTSLSLMDGASSMGTSRELVSGSGSGGVRVSVMWWCNSNFSISEQ